MNHPLITMPADDIAAVITFLSIAVVLAAVLVALEQFGDKKPKRKIW
jgi:hypothetical protein